MKWWEEKFSAIMSVYLVMENDHGEVFLLRRANTGFADGQLGLPAGHVDGGELLHDAMVREAHEEVGVTITPDDLSLIHTIHRNCGDHERMDFFFHARTWQEEPHNAEPHKCSEVLWCPKDSLPDDVIDYYQQMFNCWHRGESLSYFGW